MADKDFKEKLLHKEALTIVFPVLFATILAGIYALDIWPVINGFVVNILYIPIAIAELVFGFVECNNKKKACIFSVPVIISTIAVCINLRLDFAVDGNKQSGWSWMWASILFVSIVSLISILIRLFKWSQDQWDQVQRLKQEYQLDHRKKIKDFWSDYMLSVRNRRLGKLEKRHDYQQQEEDYKLEAGIEKQKIKGAQLRLKYLQIYAKEQEHGYGNIFNKKSRFYHVGRIIGIAVILFAFVFVPFLFDQEVKTITDWFNAIGKIILFITGQSIEDDRNLLFYYLIFLIMSVAVVWSIIHLAYIWVTKNKDTRKLDSNSISAEEYMTPVSILIIAAAILYVVNNSVINDSSTVDIADTNILNFGGSNFDISNIIETWFFCLVVILFLVVFLTTLEIVRLVLKQCLEKSSLLKNLIHLIFVAAMDFLSGLLIGVITTIHIQSVISSLIYMFLPNMNTPIREKLVKIQNKILHKELDTIAKGKDISKHKNFYHKNIWRR